jgi:hypothetical protein
MTAYNARVAAVPMPDRIRRLPVSSEGYPVPWFVHFDDAGVPDFRVVGRGKMTEAVNRKRCWVCGQPLGRTFAMTLGPMCAINRTISEPPSHRECAVFSALACPFLANPRMRRNEADLPDHKRAAGNGILRNPGAVCVWMTRSYRPFKAPGGVLFTFSDPEQVLWFAGGRMATRAQVDHAINTGLPILRAEAEAEGPAAVAALNRMIDALSPYLPIEASQVRSGALTVPVPSHSGHSI